MNVIEFAEQIVFGKTLEDKLLVPGRLSHSANVQSPDVRSLRAPGRPIGLQMRHDKGGTGTPPRDDQLENERARGELLHFLANHELLATELMALVLLKFPDAPHAFRQGILVTLQEEQEHTRMYIKRMRECGVEFGDYPLGGRFWRIVEPMQSPMDFVSRLSLTFEQANLDYSLHFSSVFDRIGDSDTAGLLQKIYEDEIGHVQHGLHWFRKWKNPEQSDWEAYQESLEFPISPQHGRGPRSAFNREGRLLAGLTDDFIDSMEVFHSSSRRTPTVRWFDPGAEARLAGECDPHLIEQLGNDLELVMVPVARQEDIVLVRDIPSRDLQKHLIHVGFELPEFVEMDARQGLANRCLRELKPWAWTPDNYRFAKPFDKSVERASPSWSNDQAELFRKSWSTDCLSRWLCDENQNNIHATPTPDWFATSDCVGIQVFDQGDVRMALDEIHSRGFERAIFKLDLGASGRGQRRFETGRKMDKPDEAWLRSVFSGFEAPASTPADVHDSFPRVPVGVVEPELDRLVDLSFLWDVKLEESGSASAIAGDDGLKEGGCGQRVLDFLGWTRALVAPGRKYVGTRLSEPFLDCVPEVRRFLLADRGKRIETISNWLDSRMPVDLLSRQFAGFFGVDAFLYRDANGELRVKPIVELNPRMTMGHVALAMQKKVAAGLVAEFRILTKFQWDSLPDAIKRAPMMTARDGRWKSGIVRLSDVNEDTKLVPVVLVGRECVESAVF